MQAFVPFARLGGIIPKTVTAKPRIGNPPPRTVETASGMLNSIGLDNDGIDTFVAKHLPYLSTLGAPIIANIAAHDADEFVSMAAQLSGRTELAGLELNLSCPNVAGGTDFAKSPDQIAKIVGLVREKCDLPLIAKLTPLVNDIVAICEAAVTAGADAVSLSNTFPGMAIDWKKRKPMLGNVVGGLSGPCIKPMVLRMVYTVTREAKTKIPIIAVGGIQSLGDVMEFLLAGASAVQIGTANFYNPSLSATLADELAAVLHEWGLASVSEVVGTLKVR